MKKGLIYAVFSLLALFSQAQDSWNVDLLFNWSDTSLDASIVFENTYNEIWGVYINDREFAIIGTTAGTHIFDVTDPGNAYLADFIPGAFQGPLVIHRDYHDFEGYLYIVCDEGPSTLQIADLTTLPDSVTLVYDSDGLLATSHNIFIDSASAMLYACGTRSSNGFNALEGYSLADPENPIYVGAWNDVGYVHDIYVENDTAFCNAANEGLYVMDFSDWANPFTLDVLDFYQDQGYNHSGWYSKETGTYLFMDENHGLRVKVCDATDVTDISIQSFYTTGIDTNSIPHNVTLVGEIAYMSYYHDGLYIVNVSDQANPVTLGYYDTYTPADHDSYRGAWGVYPYLPSGNILVSDMQYGLFVFRYAPPTGIEQIQASPADFVIAPNPAFREVEISAEAENYGNVIIEMIDTNGSTIIRSEERAIPGINHWMLNLRQNMVPGIYTLRLFIDSEFIAKPIVVSN